MLIDWFTVGAQALNFLILVWLLKRFLYKPILDAVDAREQLIATELADADAKKAEAQKQREAFVQKNQAFDQQRAALMSQATVDAKAERQRLFDEAKKAADALSAKRQETLQSDARRLDEALCRRTQREVFAIARKALTDLASESLEGRAVEVFIGRLSALDGKAREDLAAALKTTPGSAPDSALLRSAFDLPATERATLQKALEKAFPGIAPLRFETAPDLVSGIELTANGQKIAWSISDYLISLKNGVDDLLKQMAEPAIAPKPETKKQ